MPRIACAVVALLLAPAAGRAGPQYAVDVISSEFYPQIQQSWATWINDSGVALGSVVTPSPYAALPVFYPAGGGITPVTAGVRPSLAFFPGGGISNGGLAAISMFDAAFNLTSYLIRNGTATPLPPGVQVDLMTRGGLISGVRFDPSAGPFGRSQTLLIGADGTPTVLPIAGPGLTQFFPLTAMNDAGVMAVGGSNDDYSASGIYLYHIPTGGLYEVRPTTDPDFPNPSVLQVLADGRVYGQAYSADYSRIRPGGALWGPDGRFLGFFDTPGGGSVRFNDAGQALGLLDGVPYLYDGGAWAAQALPDLGGYTLSLVTDFNTRGDFVGFVSQPNGFGGQRDWGVVARRLAAPAAAPVPEPATLGLLAAGGLGLVAVRRRSRESGRGRAVSRP